MEFYPRAAELTTLLESRISNFYTNLKQNEIIDLHHDIFFFLILILVILVALVPFSFSRFMARLWVGSKVIYGGAARATDWRQRSPGSARASRVRRFEQQ